MTAITLKNEDSLTAPPVNNAYRMIAFKYGDQLPDGLGYYDHPDGGSCAIQICTVQESFNPDYINQLAEKFSSFPHIYKVVVEHFQI